MWSNIKKIIFLDPIVTTEQIEVARSISVYYAVSLMRAIQLFIPKEVFQGKVGVKMETWYQLINEDIIFTSRAKKQQDLFLDLNCTTTTPCKI